LDSVPPPDYVPPSWDGSHVGKRLVEGLRTLMLMPENGRLTMREKDGRPIGVYLVEPLVPSPRIRKAKRRRNKRPASS
jgi:hypothetical protein